MRSILFRYRGEGTCEERPFAIIGRPATRSCVSLLSPRPGSASGASHQPQRFPERQETVPFPADCFANMLTRSVAFSLGGRGFRQLSESSSMWKTVCTVALLLCVSVQAQARPYHHHRHRLFQAMASFNGDVQSSERIVSSRPSGCPHAFCGCEASLFRFGRIIPQLNLAANWRRFPRTAPAPGMAAVRSGHVMILQSHVEGNIWNVHDGNSGGHVTREHPRSIAGYTIVDPGSASFALNS